MENISTKIANPDVCVEPLALSLLKYGPQPVRPGPALRDPTFRGGVVTDRLRPHPFPDGGARGNADHPRGARALGGRAASGTSPRRPRKDAPVRTWDTPTQWCVFLSQPISISSGFCALIAFALLLELELSFLLSRLDMYKMTVGNGQP